MGRRTNTAQWLPNQNRWQIKVQKDGVRKTFTSAKPGRTGQREANAKADAWLDEGIWQHHQALLGGLERVSDLGRPPPAQAMPSRWRSSDRTTSCQWWVTAGSVT